MRTEMVERENTSLTLTRQCALLSITRTSIYYTPQTSERNKLLMDRIDEKIRHGVLGGFKRL
jgi:putative transposase